jgi:hypothetical protein
VRAALAVLVVVLVAVAAPGAAIALWSRDTLLDAHGFVDAVGPVVEHDDVQRALARATTEEVARAAGALPPGAGETIRSQTRGLVASARFAALWRSANRSAHADARELVRGHRRSSVVLDLGGLVDLVEAGLRQAGVPVAPGSVDRGVARVTVLRADDTQTARDVARWTDRLAVVLPALVGGGLVALLLLARRRGVALAAAGMLGAAGFGVALVATAGARDAASPAGDGIDEVLQRAYAHALAQPLEHALTAGLAVSLGVAAVAAVCVSVARARGGALR